MKKKGFKNLTDLEWISPTLRFNEDKNLTMIAYDVNYSSLPLSLCTKLKGELMGNSCYFMYDIFLMSVTLALGTFAIAFGLKLFRNTFFLPTKVYCNIFFVKIDAIWGEHQINPTVTINVRV